MALPSWANDTITIKRPKKVESRGSLIDDWVHATSSNVTGCSMQPASTSLSMDGRVLGVSDGWTCYVPPGTDVKEGDRIVFGSDIFVINGAPRVWTSPTGRVSAIQLNLMRWSG